MERLRRHLFLLTALLIAALVALAILLVREHPLYPVVRVSMAPDTSLVFLGDPWNQKEKCENENRKVIATLGKQCPGCAITLSECRGELGPSWMAALQNKPSDLFFVHSDTLHILIEADKPRSGEICKEIVQQISIKNKRHAECIAPRG